MPFLRQTILLLFSIFTLHISAQNTEVGNNTTSDSLSYASGILSFPDSLINYGKLFLNAPYRYGGSGSSSFDCSGFTTFVYKNFGYDLKRSSPEQAEQFPGVEKSQLQKGDLVFFSGRRKSKKVGHVGIVVSARENGEFDFIHASTNQGVVISNSQEPYYLKRYIRAGRVIGSDTTGRIARNSTPEVQPQEYVSATPSQLTRRVIPAVYHTVKNGENLSVISEKFGVSVAQLKQKNQLKSSSLHPKQRLLIREEQSYDEVVAVNETSAASNGASDKNNSKKDVLPEKHNVKKGETLISIARLYNVTVSGLRKLNDLPDGKIFVGQELKIKDAEKAVINPELNQSIANNTSKTKEEKIESTTQKITPDQLAKHTVKQGETLISISKKFNMTIDDLKSVNQLKSDRLSVGQELLVAKEQTAPAAIPTTQQQVAVTEAKPKQEPQISKKTIAPELAAKHMVKKGETLASIAQKYNMTVEDVKAANDLQSGKILIGQELVVLKNEKLTAPAETPEKTIAKTTETKEEKAPKKIILPELAAKHTVKKGETLVSIAQKYNMTVEDVKAANDLQSGKILIGQELIVLKNEKLTVTAQTTEKTVAKTTEVKEEKAPKKTIAPELATRHTVKKGETLISIAQKYNMTVEDVKAANDLQSGKILIGQQLTVLKPIVSQEQKNIPETSQQTVESKKQAKADAGSYIKYKVKTGESLFTIAKKYGVTMDDLKEWNDLSESKIIVGQILNIDKSAIKTVQQSTSVTKSSNVYVGHTFSIHEVKRGESLYLIAEENNVSVAEIITANNLKNTELAIGQKLKIPVLKNSENTTE